MQRRVPLFILVVAMTGALIIAGLSVRSYEWLVDAERERARIEEEMQHWVGIQAEIELLRTGLQAYSGLEAGLSDPDDPEGMSTFEFASQYQILKSRLALLDTEDVRDTLAASAVGVQRLAQLERLLEVGKRLDGRLRDLSPRDPEALRALSEFAQNMNAQVSRIARTMFAVETRRRAAQSARIAELARRKIQIQIALAVILTIFGVSVYVLFAKARMEHERSGRMRARIEDMVDGMPTAVMLLDSGERLELANAQARHWLQEIGIVWNIGDGLRDFLDRFAAAGLAPEAAGREQAWAQEEHARLTQGRERVMFDGSVNGRRLQMNCKGSRHGELMFTAIDVTDLIAARHQAETMATERAELMAVLGHEMKTPVVTLKGALELAEASANAEEMRHYLRHSQKSLDSLLTLSDDLFDFMTIEAGATRLEQSAFDLEVYIETFRRDFAPKAQARGLAFSVSAEGLTGERIMSDRVRLGQIIDNLLNNALKYTETGGVHLDASLARSEGSTAALLIEVADTGIGVPVDERARIFEPFGQSSLTRERGAGVGLGLALCKRLAGLLGGDLDLRDNPGGGSVFSLRFPVSLAEAPGKVEPPPAPARQLRALLVEDHAPLAEVTIAQLEKRGFSVVLASGVAEALECLERERFDGIILDLNLPDGHGLEVARSVRSAEEGERRIFIAVVTAYADEARQATCWKAGVDAIQHKPLDPLKLSEQLVAHAEAHEISEMRAERTRELSDLLGSDALKAHIAALRTDIADMAKDPALRNAEMSAEARADLARRAHQACGHARLLGFQQTAETLLQIERDLQAGRTSADETTLHLREAIARLTPDDEAEI